MNQPAIGKNKREPRITWSDCAGVAFIYNVSVLKVADLPPARRRRFERRWKRLVAYCNSIPRGRSLAEVNAMTAEEIEDR